MTATVTGFDADLVKDCPVCDGSGETAGRGDPDTNALETRTCWFCAGHGFTDVDAYACTTCHAVLLAEETCQHTGTVLCRDCAGRCSDCQLEDLERRAEQAWDWDREDGRL